MRIAYAKFVLFVMWVIFINAGVSGTDVEALNPEEEKNVIVSKGNIITAPSSCPPMQKRDRRNRCRRIYRRWYGFLFIFTLTK